MIIIGISGASASGKTSLAAAIVNEMGSDDVAVISEDSYYKDLSHLPLDVRRSVNFDHPDSLDHNYLLSQIEDLKNGKHIYVPAYDYSKHSRISNGTHVDPRHIIVLEGILLFSDPRVRNLLDIKIYIDAPQEICLLRRIKRDIRERGYELDFVLHQYEHNVLPMFLEWIAPTKTHADIIISGVNDNKVAVDLIKTKINSVLRKMLND